MSWELREKDTCRAFQVREEQGKVPKAVTILITGYGKQVSMAVM
jgi:hypothetical protein